MDVDRLEIGVKNREFQLSEFGEATRLEKVTGLEIDQKIFPINSIGIG